MRTALNMFCEMFFRMFFKTFFEMFFKIFWEPLFCWPSPVGHTEQEALCVGAGNDSSGRRTMHEYYARGGAQ